MDTSSKIIRIYSDDIRMLFRLDKWIRMISNRGKIIRAAGAELPEGNIADVEDSYKYLGVAQANWNHEEGNRKSAITKYLHKVRQVLRRQLNGQSKSQAFQHLFPASDQMPHWYNNLPK